jgi:hypothetical protein
MKADAPKHQLEKQALQFHGKNCLSQFPTYHFFFPQITQNLRKRSSRVAKNIEEVMLFLRTFISGI